jgi:hypothetical protein
MISIEITTNNPVPGRGWFLVITRPNRHAVFVRKFCDNKRAPDSQSSPISYAEQEA